MITKTHSADQILAIIQDNPAYGKRDICTPHIGQFMGIQLIAKRLCFGQECLIMIYCAYNAMGLIGSEYNGIAILNHTSYQVVLDRHLEQSSGYQCPTALQKQEVQRLVEMSDDDFKAFVNAHPRCRDGSEFP